MSTFLYGDRDNEKHIMPESVNMKLTESRDAEAQK